MTIKTALLEWSDIDPETGRVMDLPDADRASLAAHLRKEFVSVEDVIGCINKRVNEAGPLGPPYARPMTDVERELSLLCDDIRALTADTCAMCGQLMRWRCEGCGDWLVKSDLRSNGHTLVKYDVNGIACPYPCGPVSLCCDNVDCSQEDDDD